MASYPVSLDAGINTELTGSSSRGPRIPGFKASSLYPPEAKERALTWSRLFFFTYKNFLPSSVGDPNPCFFAVLEIRIRMFFGLPDPHSDSLVKIRIRILPSSSKNSKKNLYFYCFVASL
jgi:hypothetical protein